MFEFVRDIADLRLLKDPLILVGLLLASSAGHITLVARLDDFLRVTLTCKSKSKQQKHFDIAMLLRGILLGLGSLGAASLVLTVVRWLMEDGDPNAGWTIGNFLDGTVPLLTALHLILLIPVGIVICNAILEYHRHEIAESLSLTRAVVYLHGKRVISGSLLDLDFLFTVGPLPLVGEDKTVTYIERSEIATIFIQESTATERAFPADHFSSGPSTLTITFPRRETFPETKYYDRGGFRVMQINKVSTRTRFAMARQELVI